MDRADAEILEMLQRDARATQQEIARRVGLSQPSVAERIRKLEQRGIIRGYVARVDPGALGRDITAFVGVTVEHPKYFQRFAQAVLEMPDVLECHRVAGQDSYVLKIRTQNTRTLDELLTQRLRTLPGVTRTLTTIVLSSIKEETSIPVPTPEAQP